MEEFLRLPEFCSLRFLLEAEGSRLPLDRPHPTDAYLSCPLFPGGQSPCSSPLHSICLPGVAAGKPSTLSGDNLQKKTNSRSSQAAQQAGEIVPILLVPGFKVHVTFYEGDQPSQGAGWRAWGSPGGQLSSDLRSPCFLAELTLML